MFLIHNILEQEVGGGQRKKSHLHTTVKVYIFLISIIKLKLLWLEMPNKFKTEKLQAFLHFDTGNIEMYFTNDVSRNTAHR